MKVETGKDLNKLIQCINNDGIKLPNNKYSKKILLLMGYFHGYKAYRFISVKGIPNRIKLDNFKEIQLLYDLDRNLKSLFYPCIMQFETALKNYVINVVSVNNKADIDTIFNDHTILKDLNIPSSCLHKCSGYLTCYDKYIARTYNVKVSSIQSFAKTYNHLNNSIKNDTSQSSLLLRRHYRNENEKIPFWALMKFITFGNLMYFIKILRSRDREAIQKRIGVYDKLFNGGKSHGGKLLYNHMQILLLLRNAIAHDGIVFDCRFNNSSKDHVNPRKRWNRVIRDLYKNMQIPGITFSSIEDYLILLYYYLYNMNNSNEFEVKINLKKILLKFENYISAFRRSMIQYFGASKGASIFDTVFNSKVFNKIKFLYKFIS